MVEKIIKAFAWGFVGIGLLLYVLLFALNIANGGHPGPCKPPYTSSSCDSYINSDGDEVSMPVYTKQKPENATAQCNNGSYSFSQHRSGTCSKEGGVAEWY